MAEVQVLPSILITDEDGDKIQVSYDMEKELVFYSEDSETHNQVTILLKDNDEDREIAKQMVTVLQSYING